MGASIAFEGVSHRFERHGIPVLAEVGGQVAPGETVALIGRSGCGKSTLLHILAGLIRPVAGVVRIDGRPVTGPSSKWNLMFQQPSLYPWMTAAENAALGLTFAGARRGKAETARRTLGLVGLEDQADANVQTLSGGQQQRVALARSLATEPDVLLLDEPFSSLDAFTRAALQDEVVRVTDRLGLTVLLVTHDIEEAAVMADRVLVMGDRPGRISAELPISLPRPRDRGSPAVLAVRNTIMRQFETSLCLRAA